MTSPTPQSSPQPPDGGWGWMVVVGAFIVSGCTAGIFRSLGVFFLTFSRQFQASSADTAWITSILMSVTYFLSPVGTALASTIGFRPTVMLGGVLSAAGYIISGFATRMFHLYLGIGCLTGVGYALTLSPAMAIVGQYFTKRRALANSLTLLGSSVTSMSFPPLFQYLMDEYGLKGALLIIGGIMLNMVMDFKVMKIPAVALFLTSMFIVSFCLIVPPLYIVPRAKYLQIEDYTAASLLSVISIADMVSRLAVGAVPDNPRFGRLDQFGLSLCLLGISNLLSPLAKTYPALVAYAIAHGVFYGAFIPISLTCLAELVGPKRLPSAIGILMSVQGFASLSGPPFAG
uniref:Major facilitator superfamily (MFS) profile domain-containing protein n=1 Tax=Branchiostoma floridae TaxID=7739 RepID=C3YBI2_BRAFL|eukprot:XP_002606329.1 hypothetical protein BRAFLDRAFT_67571 [Branchiostoma floridae]